MVQIAHFSEKMKEEEVERLHRDIGMTFYSFKDCDDIENYVEKKELSDIPYKEDDGYKYENMDYGTNHKAGGSGDGKEEDFGKGKKAENSVRESHQNNFCLDFHGNSKGDCGSECVAFTKFCGL